MNFCTERVGLVIPEHTQMIFKEYKYLYIYKCVYGALYKWKFLRQRWVFVRYDKYFYMFVRAKCSGS